MNISFVFKFNGSSFETSHFCLPPHWLRGLIKLWHIKSKIYIRKCVYSFHCWRWLQTLHCIDCRMQFEVASKLWMPCQTYFATFSKELMVSEVSTCYEELSLQSQYHSFVSSGSRRHGQRRMIYIIVRTKKVCSWSGNILLTSVILLTWEHRITLETVVRSDRKSLASILQQPNWTEIFYYDHDTSYSGALVATETRGNILGI